MSENQKGKKQFNRNLNWEKAISSNNKNIEQFIAVPIEYLSDDLPGLIFYNEETRFKERLKKQYIHPINEYLIIKKEKNINKVFIAQIAFDLFHYNINKITSIRLDKLTGFLLLSEWDDIPIEGTYFVNGKSQFSFSSIINKKAKTSCNQYIIEYQTVNIQSCGTNCTEITVTLHRESFFVCGGASNQIGNLPYYDPLSNGSGGYNNYQTYNYLNYNPRIAVCDSSSSDRFQINEALINALYATGLGTSITGFSLDKANALARSIGGNLSNFKGIINGVGIAGILIGTVQLGFGIYENGYTNDEDGLNAIQVALGITGLLAGGWIAVGAGAVSIGIAVYSHTTTLQPVCQ